MNKIKSFFSNFGNKSNQPIFVRNFQDGGANYEIYKCSDSELAKGFLVSKSVDKPLHYIIVETPDGNWGIDLTGLFLENLRQPTTWRLDVDKAKCEGIFLSPKSSTLQAAQGISDNFIANVMCGKCKQTWIDGIGLNKWTVVRCPNCKTLNKIKGDVDVYMAVDEK